MIIFGFFLQFVGFLLCLTVIGAVIGVPLILIGGIVVVFGFFGRRKTVIQNVVTVQNAAPAAPERAPQPPRSSNDAPPA
jgi:hypothetical protein